MDDRPIGIFDSGVGGLTVFNAIKSLLPKESAIYLGDTARVPYGNRSSATVQKYAKNATRLLLNQDIKALVIACNTASAYAYESLKASTDIPVIAVISPVAAEACKQTKTKTIGVIGTRGTIRSEAYKTEIAKLEPNIEVISVACPMFVPLAEELWVTGTVPEDVAQTYLSAFAETDIDTLILGCTHYPILRDVIARTISNLCDREVEILDCATSAANSLAARLRQLDSSSESVASYRFWATDDPNRFAESASSFTDLDHHDVEHVEITDV